MTSRGNEEAMKKKTRFTEEQMVEILPVTSRQEARD
jgi:hypothetical protein